MNKNLRGLIAVALVGGIGYGVYRLAFKKKNAYAKYIFSHGKNDSMVALMSFDEPYLKEWVRAIRKNKDTFQYLDKTYNTNGGRAVA